MLARLMLLWCVAAPNGAVASTHETVAFNVDEIAPGVFVHRGRHAGLEDPDRGDSANIGFVIGETCVAVIDSGGSIAIGARLLAAIRARTVRPVCYVINTHGHFDHVLGNAAFSVEKPHFVGHSKLGAAIDGSREYFAEHFAVELGNPPRVVGPDIVVENELTLDLGERELKLKAHPIAHSDSDLTVFDVRTQTLWSGDLLFIERLPVLDGKLTGWLAWMETAAMDKVVRVIPGHGPVSAQWPKSLDAQREYLLSLIATVKKALAAGEFLENVTAKANAPPGWQLSAAHTRNLSRAYREFEWQ
ncbi:MAG: quinoprotein relay system zinc metallohydrolase 2 [Gammaproteobacteria bacterium]